MTQVMQPDVGESGLPFHFFPNLHSTNMFIVPNLNNCLLKINLNFCLSFILKMFSA